MPGILGTILVGGGTGFVGSHLIKLLQKSGYGVKVISRMPGPQRISWQEVTEKGLPPDVTAVVNLAGQNVLDMKQKWNAGFKQNIWNSRVNTTAALAKAISHTETKPNVFIVMNGVGYYEPSEEVEYTEHTTCSEFDFLSKLCHHWEAASELPTHVNTRRVVIRSGVVLGKDGGMIKKLYLPFYLGLGGPVGHGKQYLPWIHIEDLTRLILFSIENDTVQGVVNGVAPQQVTNKDFAKAFARAMKRPAIFPLPERILNILLHNERAKILTEGQRVVPAKLRQYGFKYHYPDIQSACREVVS